MPAKVMAEEGIEISRKETKSVFDFHEQAKGYSYVITACDAEAAEHCPIFPHNLKVIEFTDSYREDPVQTIKEAHAPAIEVKMSRGRPAAWNKPEQCPGYANCNEKRGPGRRPGGARKNQKKTRHPFYF